MREFAFSRIKTDGHRKNVQNRYWPTTISMVHFSGLSRFRTEWLLARGSLEWVGFRLDRRAWSGEERNAPSYCAGEGPSRSTWEEAQTRRQKDNYPEI